MIKFRRGKGGAPFPIRTSTLDYTKNPIFEHYFSLKTCDFSPPPPPPEKPMLPHLSRKADVAAFVPILNDFSMLS